MIQNYLYHFLFLYLAKFYHLFKTQILAADKRDFILQFLIE